MKKQFPFLISLLLLSACLQAQNQPSSALYHPEEDAARAMDQAISAARSSGRHVLLQIGGNWCSWCIRFAQFCQSDKQIDSLLKADYVIYHLNYSKENRNSALMSRLGFPQRFGFPVFVILDGEGHRLHTQNSAYLEEGKSYSREKVIGFLQDWSPRALDPAQYEKY